MTSHPAGGERKIRLAPAKLNLRLKITARRPDGYHDLVSVMVAVTLYDRLEFTLTPAGKIDLDTEGLYVPGGKENLVHRAARAFFSRIGMRQGISIRLAKHIAGVKRFSYY